MALSQVAAKHLKTPAVTVVTLLYSLFSYIMFKVLLAFSHPVTGFIADLQALNDTEGLKTQAALNHVEAGGFLDPTIVAIIIFGTFIAAVLYMPYNHFRTHNENT